jgi:hypothetical protein
MLKHNHAFVSRHAHMALHRTSLRFLGPVLICLPVVIVISVQLTLYLWRPMFTDRFGIHEFGLFAGWNGIPGITFDRYGTGVKIDRILNVIVLFHSMYGATDGDRDDVRHLEMALGMSCRSTSKETMNGARFVSEDGVEYLVPRRANRVFVFERNGRRRELILPAGKAAECYDALFGEELVKIGVIEALKAHGVSIEGDVSPLKQ